MRLIPLAALLSGVVAPPPPFTDENCMIWNYFQPINSLEVSLTDSAVACRDKCVEHATCRGADWIIPGSQFASNHPGTERQCHLKPYFGSNGVIPKLGVVAMARVCGESTIILSPFFGAQCLYSTLTNG